MAVTDVDWSSFSMSYAVVGGDALGNIAPQRAIILTVNSGERVQLLLAQNWLRQGSESAVWLKTQYGRGKDQKMTFAASNSFESGESSESSKDSQTKDLGLRLRV